MDLHQRAIDYIESKLPDLYSSVYAIPMAEGKEGIAVTVAPSRLNNEYMNGKKDDNMLLQITAKAAESQKAYDVLWNIAYLLESAQKKAIESENNSFCFNRASIYSSPNFAYMDTNQTFVYVTMINLEFERW